MKMDQDHQRFRQIVKGRIRDDLRKFLSKGELIGKEGKHLISIPVTNTSVNPARSTASAVFVGGLALQQLWLFWVAPIAGAALAGITYRFITGSTGAETLAAEGQSISRATSTIGEATSRGPVVEP